MSSAFRRFFVGGRSAATAATANHAAAILWNAATDRAIWVVQISCTKTVGTADEHALRRATARGTAGSTVTVGSPMEVRENGSSSVVLDLAAYSVQPTLAAGELKRDNLPATVGAGWVWVPTDPIYVPPGRGLGIVTPSATVLQPSDFSFEWYE